MDIGGEKDSLPPSLGGGRVGFGGMSTRPEDQAHWRVYVSSSGAPRPLASVPFGRNPQNGHPF